MAVRCPRNIDHPFGVRPMRLMLAFAAAFASTLCFAAERAIEKEAVVNAAPAAVYSAWSTGEGLQSFFSPEAVVDARPEGAFSIHFNPYASAGLRGADDMHVLAAQPGKMISFTWNAPPQFPEVRPQRTVVIVR